MTKLQTTSCCGMIEIVNLSHSTLPKDALVTLQAGLTYGIALGPDDPRRRPPGFVLFTGVVDRTMPDHASSRLDNYGKKFADFIEANGLGDVISTQPVVNSFTGNKVVAWIWTVDHARLRNWYASQAAAA